jgi:antitoxin (DNA-binding transcriptional repressor) of toxin-antitoxin stability system
MTLTIEDAQARLPELLASLPANEELVICQGGTPVARLTRLSRTSWPYIPGDHFSKSSTERIDDVHTIVIRTVLHVFAVQARDTRLLAGCDEQAVPMGK